MCLAEALLRIPDAGDARPADPRQDQPAATGPRTSARRPSLFVNAAAWGLLVTGKIVETRSEGTLEQALSSLLRKGGEPLIRKGVDLAMRLLGRQFVTGRTIDEALANAREREARGYTFSYDMLGEAALTAADAHRYFVAYEAAIHAIGRRGEWARHRRRTRHLDQALRAASALLPRAARARAGRADAEARHARAAGEGVRHRPRDRRRGGRPPRAFARPARASGRGPGARGLGRPRLRRAVLPEARAADDRLDRRARRGSTGGA